MDLFVLPTIGFNLLYALIIVRLARRELVWVNVTAAQRPNGSHVRLQRRFPETRHRGPGSGCDLWHFVKRRLRSMGIRDKPIFGWFAMAERLIGSIRRKCVDHLVVFDEFAPVLRSYVRC